MASDSSIRLAPDDHAGVVAPEPDGKPASPSRRAPSLTEQAYQALEELIVTLALEPGSVMSESVLAERLGIGRTPVREALQRLAREGLVTVMPRRGIRVAPMEPETHVRLLELRRALEQLLAEGAAERASADQRAAFADLADGMAAAAETADAVAFMRLDRQFNRLLCQAARNDYVTRAMALIQGLSRRFWYRHYRRALDLPLCAELHANMARAIADGRPARAVAAAERLIGYIETVAREDAAAEGTQRSRSAGKSADWRGEAR